MTIVKTSELSGAALDYAVATCDGWYDYDQEDKAFRADKSKGYGWLSLDEFNPSTDWAHGGAIIEREGLSIEPFKGRSNDWRAFDFKEGHVYAGESALIAAMRCYVASKLGEAVDVPDTLLSGV